MHATLLEDIFQDSHANVIFLLFVFFFYFHLTYFDINVFCTFAQDDLKAIFSAFSMDYHAWRAGKIGADLKSVAALLLCFWESNTVCSGGGLLYTTCHWF